MSGLDLRKKWRATVTPWTRAPHHTREKTMRTPSPPSGSPYVYSPISKGHIRLLTIKSSSTQSPTYYLDTYPQDRAPKYDALSYCWGEDQTPAIINCNDSDILIWKSLFVTLQYLADRPRPRRPLWIDAICLNQDDDVEKAIQVPRMHEIYKHATKTVVWLGEPDGDSDLALVFMAEVISHLKQDGISESIDRYQREREWKALRGYLSRPWFKRLWVAQEVVLSQHIEILCHSRNYRTISWQQLIHFLAIVEKDNLDTGLMEDSYHSGMNAKNLEDRRLEVGKDGYISFAGGIFLGEDRLCREPVDRVWAILGLLKFELVAVIQQANIIDYSESGKRDYWKTYLAVMKLLYTEDVPGFELLVFSSVSLSKHPSLPSWCADFHLARTDDSILFARKFRSGFLDREDLKQAVTELDTTSDALYVIGFNISEVRTVTSLAPGWEMDWLPWFKQCEKLTLGVSSESQEAVEALAETLALADDRVRKLYPNRWDQYYQCLRGKYETTDYDDNECPHGEEEMHESYGDLVRNGCKGRTFFTTSDGRIGLASGDVRVGDKICVFIGTEPLFVLRDIQPETPNANKGQQAEPEIQPESSQETFILIGDAYVHGLMFGEAFTAEGRGRERKYKIV